MVESVVIVVRVKMMSRLVGNVSDGGGGKEGRAASKTRLRSTGDGSRARPVTALNNCVRTFGMIIIATRAGKVPDVRLVVQGPSQKAVDCDTPWP